MPILCSFNCKIFECFELFSCSNFLGDESDSARTGDSIERVGDKIIGFSNEFFEDFLINDETFSISLIGERGDSLKISSNNSRDNVSVEFDRSPKTKYEIL